MEKKSTNSEKNYYFPLAIFSFLFLFAIFYDSRNTFYNVFDNTLRDFDHIISLGLCFSGALLLIKPSSSYRLAAFMFFLIVDVLLSLPIAPNHTVFEMLIAITVLASFITAKIKYKNEFTGKKFYDLSAPVLRIQVVVLYFWATVHKINTGFLDKYIGCATVQIFNIKQSLTILPAPEWFISINPYLTLLIEGSLPILFLIPSTRLFGVILGVLFHFVLGFRYTGFTIIIYSLFALFIAEANYDRLKPYVDRFRSAIYSKFSILSNYNSWDKSRADRVFIQICLAFVVLVLLKVLLRGGAFGVRLISTEDFYIIIFAVCIAASLILLINQKYRIIQDVKLIPSSKYLLIFPIIFFFNGFLPHIGLKNIQAVAMFSNLRTGDGTTNHLIFPASLQIFPYLKDTVEIKGSNSKTINQFSGYTSIRPMRQTSIKFPSGYIEYLEENNIDVEQLYRYKIPFIKLQDFVTRAAEGGRKGLRIEYVRGGKTYYTENAELEPELNSLSLFKRKFLSQRAVPDDERGLCMW